MPATSTARLIVPTGTGPRRRLNSRQHCPVVPGEAPENLHDSAALLEEHFGKKPKYADVPGLCKVATLAEIEAQSWSLNPGRYVGVAARDEDDFDFKERLEEQNEELETLNAESRELETRIAENVTKLLEQE